jgi:hypothetical protein
MPQNPNQLADDIVITDLHRDPKIIVSLAGRYALANRRDRNGNRSEIPCRIVSISSSVMTLLAPAKGAIGERVITHCHEFGKLEGSIIRVLDSGFVISIAAKGDERAKLAAKIDWYERNKNHDLAESRGHKRIIPKNPHSTLILADNSEMACLVIDVSISGVAVSADSKPEIGTQLTVGKIVGRVVRHFADGFAVQFIELQNLDFLEQGLT